MTLNAPIPTMPEAEFRKWLWRYWPEVSKISALAFGLPWIFGNGEDGDTTISTDTDLTPYRIYQYKTLTINATKTLSLSSPGVMVLYIMERCIISGTINLASLGHQPNDATQDTWSTSYSGAGAGGGIGSSEDGLPGDNTVMTGGAGGTSGHPTGYDGHDISTLKTSEFRMKGSAKENILSLMGGGGGDGGNNYSSDGRGGYGGGGLFISCPEVIIESSGLIYTDGQNGSGGTGNSGGGGGGGGGGIYIITQSYNNSGGITVDGGLGGSSTTYGEGGVGGSGFTVVETMPY